ncbi:MAG: hypothetical protein WC201_05195 [Bacilli bacterium]
MGPLEIIVIIISVIIVGTVIGVFIYKKIKGLPTGECGECRKGTKKLLKKYHKMYQKK